MVLLHVGEGQTKLIKLGLGDVEYEYMFFT